MKPLTTSILAFTLLLTSTTLLHAAEFPAWRGPNSNGIILSEPAAPVEWSGSDNITWKTKLPAPGNSSPIIYKDRIFLTAALDEGKTRTLTSFNQKTGKPLWTSKITYTEKEPTHKTNPFASASPVTDGHRVYVSFGSAGLYAFDFNTGKQLWHRPLGKYHHIWGNAASPVLYKDTVIQFCSPGPAVKLVAVDKRTGKVIYTKIIPEAQSKDIKQFYGSWSTPLIFNNEGRDELLLALPKKLVSLNPRTGKEFWHCTGLTDLVYAQPIISNNVIVAMSGYMGAAIGVRIPGASAKGDVTKTHLIWRTPKNQQRIGSGLAIGDYLYICNEPGVAQCINIQTGKELWKKRLGVNSWSSMIYAGGKIYVTDTHGTTHVLRPGTTFDKLRSNKLAEKEMTRATIAFRSGQAFIRTYSHLYCIGTATK